MSNHFSTKFKHLRKAKDLTQDQIADIFHVSPQSVSRWETGANYPDIEMLPHIALFFKITVDELLGTELIAGEEKAKQYVADIRNLLNVGKTGKAVETARMAVKEYPVNYSLQFHLMQALSASNSEKYQNEIIAVAEKIMNYCTDQEICLGAKFELIMRYAEWGMKGDAKKIACTLPGEAYFTQDLTMLYVLEGEELQEDLKLRIIRFTIMLREFIKKYANDCGLDWLQKIECLKAAQQIECLTVPISGFNGGNVDHIVSAFQNINIAELYCEAGDTENALAYVENAVRDSMHHIDIMDKTNEDGSNYYPWSTPRNLPWILWEDHLMKPQFDILRNNQRFIKCFEWLKANSREL